MEETESSSSGASTELASSTEDESLQTLEASRLEPEESPEAQLERPSSEVAVPPRNQEPSPSDAESGPRSAEEDGASSTGSSDRPVEPLMEEDAQAPKPDEPAPTPPESSETESREPI